jgi:hypothetical protein
MRLYGAIQKIEPQDDGTVRVYGIATSEAVDDQGEIVQADAMRTALPEYMRFPALREMHQLSAAGTTLEAEVCEDGTTRIVAHVVDPVAVAKVKNQVYRGFSIGGRVLQRAAGNPKTITSLLLNEISLVDRPANPEAVFDCWKAAGIPGEILDETRLTRAEGALATSAPSVREQEPFHPPIQIWACGVSDHCHLAKADAIKCLEKRARASEASGAALAPAGAPEIYEENGNPGKMTHSAEQANFDAHEIADSKKKIEQKIDDSGPLLAGDRGQAVRSALKKTLLDVGHVARVLVELDWLRRALDLEVEDDDPSQAARLQEIIVELCEFLDALVAEETGEILADLEADRSCGSLATSGMLARETGKATGQKVRSDMKQLAADILTKTEHSQGDQALLDMARLACDRCLRMPGPAVTARDNLRNAREYLDKAGALRTQGTASDTTIDVGELSSAQRSLLGVSAGAVGNASRAHQSMMDLAHECIKQLTDGIICPDGEKAVGRRSVETMDNLMGAHHHLVLAGANCEETNSSGSNGQAGEGRPMSGETSEKIAQVEELAKALTVERTEKMALGKALDEIMPMLQRLTERVDEIARTPLPPLTIAKGTVSVSKQQDQSSGGGGLQLSPETIASALGKMSKEEQTLTLIKASYANPIRVHGPATDDR